MNQGPPSSPAPEAQEHVRCPLHPEREAPLLGQDLPRGYDLRRCPDCGLMFVSPRPSFEALCAVEYTAGYYASERTPSTGDPPETHERELELLRRHQAGGALLEVGAGDGGVPPATLGPPAGRWRSPMSCPYPLDGLRRDGFPVHQGRLGELEIESSFGVVRFRQVLEHTQDPLAELERGRTSCCGPPAWSTYRCRIWPASMPVSSRPSHVCT